MSIAKQVTMATISQPDVERLSVPVPKDINEQEEISKRLLSHTQIIQKEEATLIKYKNLKLGLMSALLTGRKRVKVEEN